MQKITPCLWFDREAEEAMKFYVSVFRNSKVACITHYEKGGPLPEGTVLTASFLLDGQEFVALNGGPDLNFNHAISFIVNCVSQEEVDYYWEKLSDGGSTEQCGWLLDRYGVSWQIVPTILPELFADPDRQKAQRVMTAMLSMNKIEIDLLRQAASSE
jgi:predicted 3-demethylubiquinone-9 3-methyltransferase (glyoxalase superfamily)